MISFLSGAIVALNDDHVVIELHGVGFAVRVADTTPFSIGSSAKLFTVLRWHPEEGPSLYGFPTISQRALFEHITSCSGFGPKIALAFCRTLTPRALCQAIAQEEYGVLTTVDGVGRKKAEALVFHLKDKLEQLMALDEDASAGIPSMLHDVHEALKSLGYARHEITAATTNLGAAGDFNTLLRLALHRLSSQ